MTVEDETLVDTAMKASYFIEDAHRRLGTRAVLPFADARLLWVLRERGPATRRALENVLMVGQSTVNRQVGGCLDRGLVEIEKSQESRGDRIKATDLGLDLFQQHLHHYLSAYREALSVVREEDRQSFVEMLFAYGEKLANEVNIQADLPRWDNLGTQSKSRTDLPNGDAS